MPPFHSHRLRTSSRPTARYSRVSVPVCAVPLRISPECLVSVPSHRRRASELYSLPLAASPARLRLGAVSVGYLDYLRRSHTIRGAVPELDRGYGLVAPATSAGATRRESLTISPPVFPSQITTHRSRRFPSSLATRLTHGAYIERLLPAVHILHHTVLIAIFPHIHTHMYNICFFPYIKCFSYLHQHCFNIPVLELKMYDICVY